MKRKKRVGNLPSKPAFDEVIAMKRSLADESERGSALVALAFIEDSLSHAIRARLPGSDASVSSLFTGPLRSLKPKLALALALDVITLQLATEIRLLAEIRNRFAHTRKPLSFEEPSVATLCGSLLPASISQTLGGPTLPARALFEGSASLVTIFLSADEKTLQYLAFAIGFMKMVLGRMKAPS
jgi:hypothetical protein